ncbi:5'-3' exonuclease [Clostridium sp. MCC353]|uniref:5'-3' exonuclease n=1 Tax=Clostridium sp. MCC353 TaxID=2592646 RepID=UPI001C01A735|nr:5'-3' exonuclease H3TH domain-containing protein [Clostridium sp. MCC353]MBT9778439.1 5'-3' exonuclease [Clostridium sp. MCC353]
MSEKKLVIVDGSSMLSTCYYAVLPREIMFAKTEEEKQKHYNKILQSEDGVYTNAIFGMLKMVVSLIKKQKPDYMAFVFDKTRDTFRRELYQDYKGTRSVTPAPLKEQFILMEQILEDVGFKVLYSDRYEADDYAGSLVMKFRDRIPVVVMTKDHDYLQLVNDEHNVRAWMVQAKQEKAEELYEKYYSAYGMTKKDVNLPEKVFEFTAEHVFAEEGVWPEQIVDLKGIQGDTSDNIPGVKGVSSAAPLLLNEYGTVEELYSVIHEAETDKKALKDLQDFWKTGLGISRSPYKSLTKTGEEGELCGEAAAVLSKQLAAIKTDIPLDYELEDFSVGLYQEECLKNWCNQLNIQIKSVFGK